MYGRLLRDIQFIYDPQTVVRGFDNFLQKQLAGGFGPGVAPTTTVSITTSVFFSGTTSALQAAAGGGFSPTITGVSSFDGLASGMGVSAMYGGAAVFNQNAVLSIQYDPTSGLSLNVNSAPLQAAPNVNITATSRRSNESWVCATFSAEACAGPTSAFASPSNSSTRRRKARCGPTSLSWTSRNSSICKRRSRARSPRACRSRSTLRAAQKSPHPRDMRAYGS